MGITSGATGLITSLAPHGHHLIFASGGFLLINMVLWVTKYLVYHKIIFKAHPREAVEIA
jgi:hypothetical protein